MLAAHRERARALGARVRQARGEDLTAAILRVEGDGGGRYDLLATFPGTVVYGALGLDIPAGLRDIAEMRLEVSAEQLGRGVADVLFAYASELPGIREAETSLSQLRDNPLFRGLRAVRAGEAHFVGAHWFGGSTIAADLVVDDLERLLLGGVGS